MLFLTTLINSITFKVQRIWNHSMRLSWLNGNLRFNQHSSFLNVNGISRARGKKYETPPRINRILKPSFCFLKNNVKMVKYQTTLQLNRNLRMKHLFIAIAVTLTSTVTCAAELKFIDGITSIKTPEETLLVLQEPMRIYSAKIAENFKTNKPDLNKNDDLIFLTGLKGVKVQNVFKYPDCTYIIGTKQLVSGNYKIYVQPIHADGLIESIAEYTGGKSVKPSILPGKEGVTIKAFNLDTKKNDKVEFSGCTDLDPGA